MAIPQILQQLQRVGLPGNLGQIKQMMDMVKSAGNPQAMLNQMMQNNPQMKQVMDLVNQHGGDAQKAFYSLANQRGIDPNQIINLLR